MRKRVIYIALLLLGVFGVAVVYRLNPTDPVYEGRHLSSWLNELHPSYSGHPYNLADRDKAEAAIRAMGTNGIPYLLALVHTHDSRLRSTFIKLTEKQNLIKFNFRQAPYHEQFRGILGLIVLGRTAIATVPDLLPLLQEGEWSVRGLAVDAVSEIGPEVPGVLPALLNTLEDPDSYVRECALRGLGRITSISPQVVSAIETHLHDPSPDLQSQSLEWLLGHTTNKMAYLPELRAQWESPNPDLRSGALRSAQWFTNSPTEVLPLINVSLHDTNTAIRMFATNLLETMSAAHRAVPAPKRETFFTFENTPVADVLDLYSAVAGQKVAVPNQLFGSVTVKTYNPVTAAEAMSLIESALDEQLHILITRTDDGHLVAVVAPRRK